MKKTEIHNMLDKSVFMISKQNNTYLIAFIKYVHMKLNIQCVISCINALMS